jgi:predicted AAA+ superfamily ATPase
LLAAEENGNTLNYSSIAQDIGVDMKTIKEYYQILIDTLMGFLLMPIKKSVRQQISKSPKFYFFDNGVQRALCEKLKCPLLKATKEFGRVFEHWLIKEIVYKSNYYRRDYKFSFYRVDDDIEVDLIIEKPNGEILAIEIKANDNPKLEKLKGLKSFAKVFPEARLICACLAQYPLKLDRGIEVLPWKDLLEQI